MMITLKKIIMQNFFSFAREEVDLDDLGYVLVSGVNNLEEDNALSNGAGKSTIFNGICYALTGTTIKGLSSTFENTFANPDNCCVELHLKADEKDIVIKRMRTPKSDMTITVDGIDKSGKGIRESTKVLNELLPGIDIAMLNSTMILGQGLPYRFSDNTPSGRKEILEKLTNSDYIIETLKDKLSTRVTELKGMQSQASVNLASSKSKLAQLRSSIATLEDNLDSLSKESGLSLDDLKDDLNKEKENRESLVEESKKYSDKLVSILEDKNKLLADKSDEILNKSNEYSSRLSNEKSKLAEKNAEKNHAEAELRKVLSIKDVCPTCHQKLSGVDKPDPAPYKEKYDLLTSECLNISKSVKIIEDERNCEIADIECLYASKISNVVANYNSVNNLISSTSSAIDEATSKINNLSSLITEESTKSAKIEQLKDSINQYKSEIPTLVKEASEAEKEVDKYTERIEVVQKMLAVTKKDFRSFLLLGAVSKINSIIARLSKPVFNGTPLRITNEDNKLNIYFGDRLYEAMSGGENRKIDIIIQLAIREYINTISNIKFNILVFDEVFDNLDAIGCDNIIKVITSFNDLSSVFIVSHHADELNIPHDRDLVVEKQKNGCSEISIK